MFKANIQIEANIIAKYNGNFISNDPLLKDIQTSNKLHSGGTVYKSDTQECELSMPLNKNSFEFFISIDDIRNFNLEGVCIKYYELADAFAESFKKMIFNNLTQITNHTGNVIDNKGKPFDCQILLELLEKTHLDFDSEGNPKLPTMVFHPTDIKRAKSIMESDEYKSKFELLINKKREQYYAEKGSRRLSRIN